MNFHQFEKTKRFAAKEPYFMVNVHHFLDLIILARLHFHYKNSSETYPKHFLETDPFQTLVPTRACS